MFISKVGFVGIFHAADIHRMFAARVKGTALRDVNQARGCTWNRIESLLGGLIEPGNGANQTTRVRVLGIPKHVIGRSPLHNPAGIHDADLVAHP